MKRNFFLAILLILSILLAACASEVSSAGEASVETRGSPSASNVSSPAEGAGESTAPASGGSSSEQSKAEMLRTDDEAISLRNQLALGILELEDSPQAISQQQARAMLPLWQALLALDNSSTVAQQEIQAVQDQIVGGMNEEQLRAIAAMQLTNDHLRAFYEARGMTLPEGGEGSAGSGMEGGNVPGSGGGVGSGLPSSSREATRAAAQASGAQAGSGGGKELRNLLTNEVIALLTERSEG